MYIYIDTYIYIYKHHVHSFRSREAPYAPGSKHMLMPFQHGPRWGASAAEWCCKLGGGFPWEHKWFIIGKP